MNFWFEMNKHLLFVTLVMAIYYTCTNYIESFTMSNCLNSPLHSLMLAQVEHTIRR